jgi:DNA modification methylase
MNQLTLGDNLEVLRKIDTESVDLIYLDPPFFSNRNYEVIWGDDGEIRSFKDRWSGGVDHYIAWLKERVIEMHRILKSTGSIFLHCDWHANAEIKVEILNKIFGYNNFRGEIVWQRTNVHSDAKKKLAVVTDTIWYYSKTENFIYNPLYIEHSEEYKLNFYKFRDEKGIYQLGDLTNPKLGGYVYEYKGYSPNQNGWRCPLKTMERWDKEGLLFFPKNKSGRLRVKRYLDDSKGVLLSSLWKDKDVYSLSENEFNAIFNSTQINNVWDDIQNVQGASKERIGYPTQKPEALLQRVIEMASNKNEVILDPFVGGGTTIAVSEKLERNWIGIDQSVQAVKVTEMRLQNQQDLFSKPFVVQLHKYDYDILRNKPAFEFETWIIEQYGGVANVKQKSDFGIDGKTKENTPIQVKRSDNIGRNVIDNFKSACERNDKALYHKNIQEKKPIGIIIAFSFGKGAVQEVARLKNQENVKIELITVAEIVPIAKKPTLTVKFNDLGTDSKKLREIEFIATAESESGIEFFAWDFDYNTEKGFNAEIFLDKEGKQTYKFKAGSYSIAVKVIDNEGLENIEIVKLKINGVVKVNDFFNERNEKNEFLNEKKPFM